MKGRKGSFKVCDGFAFTRVKAGADVVAENIPAPLSELFGAEFCAEIGVSIAARLRNKVQARQVPHRVSQIIWRVKPREHEAPVSKKTPINGNLSLFVWVEALTSLPFRKTDQPVAQTE